MSILSYKNFIDDRLLEGLRDMKFVLSKRFREQLSKIDHVISDELLSLHNDLDSKQKQTFVDMCEDKDDKITFIQSNKASELLNIETEDKYDKYDKSLLDELTLSSPVYKQFRTEVALGRFVNSVFGTSKFPAGGRIQPGVKPNDVESFVNMYKSKFKQEEKFELIDIIKGDNISYFYNSSKYKNLDGTLGGSCMGGVSSSYFDIYANNPNVGMVVLYTNDRKNKIKGRAILWENLLEPEGRTYMDRIYTNDSSDEQLFKEYAIKNGWLHKSHQGYGAESYIVDTRTGSNTQITLISQLKETDYNDYPYMDTMCYYNPDNGKISNRNRGMKYNLIDTYGGYDTIDDYDDEEVYSRYHDENIYKSEAKWCEFGEDWVRESDAIKVWNTDGKYSVPENPDIVRSYISNMIDKHFEKNRCTWSDYLNTWIFNGALINVWTDLDKTNSVVEYKKRSGITFAEVDGEFWKMDLVEKVDDKYVLKGDTITSPVRPVNAPRGWHKMTEFIDDQGNIFRRGIYVGKK